MTLHSKGRREEKRRKTGKTTRQQDKCAFECVRHEAERERELARSPWQSSRYQRDKQLIAGSQTMPGSDYCCESTVRPPGPLPFLPSTDTFLLARNDSSIIRGAVIFARQLFDALMERVLNVESSRALEFGRLLNSASRRVRVKTKFFPPVASSSPPSSPSAWQFSGLFERGNLNDNLDPSSDACRGCSNVVGFVRRITTSRNHRRHSRVEEEL